MDAMQQAKFEPVVDLKKMSADDKKKAKEIASQMDIEDSQAVIQFGVSAQNKISGFSDSILSQIRSKDSGYVGDILTDLVMKVKEVQIDKLGESGGFLESIPIIGSLINSVKRFITKYEKMSTQIETIINNLEKAKMNLLKDVTLFDTLFEKNKEYLKELDIFIAAGQIKLEELREKTIPELKAKAEKSTDQMDAQHLQDVIQLTSRFEKKLHDLKLSRMISIQTAPQIRLIQNNNQVLVEKIQSSILNTIPLWKNQAIIAIGIFRQRKALKLQKEVTETTNELLQKNSEMLKQGTLETAREAERGIVEIDTLKKVNNDLITTIEETIKIQEEGKTKRAQAEVELDKMETDLKAKLIEVKK